jgi:hypothetical protein
MDNGRRIRRRGWNFCPGVKCNADAERSTQHKPQVAHQLVLRVSTTMVSLWGFGIGGGTVLVWSRSRFLTLRYLRGGRGKEAHHHHSQLWSLSIRIRESGSSITQDGGETTGKISHLVTFRDHMEHSDRNQNIGIPGPNSAWILQWFRKS